MTTADAAITPSFDPPGPGSWEIDDVHHPRPVTRYWAEMHPAPFRRGFSEFTSYYGMLLDTLECQYVNGFAYHAVRPVADEQVPQRFQRAEETFERKLWREQLREWDETFKPTAIERHRELQSIEPDALSDEELSAYLGRCRDHHAEMIYQHMRFTGAALLPTGDFLAHVGDWTGLDPAQLLGLMRGAAPVSAGASAELEQLVATLGQDDDARRLLESDGDPGAVLAQLRSRDDDTGRAVGAYLDLVGYRLLDGFDICGPTALELPDALLRAIRTAVGGRTTDDSDVEGKIADVRGQEPEEQREEFDELLGEARLMYRLRDERGVFSDAWASGLMRRATLAAGRRVASRGRIQDPAHMIDAGVEEMCALVTDAGGPSADDL